MAIIGSVEVAVRPDFKGFHRKVKNYLNTLRDLDIKLDADFDGFREKVRAATQDVRTQVQVDANTATARAQIAAISRDQRVTLHVDVDKSQLGQVQRMISGLFDGGGSGGGAARAFGGGAGIFAQISAVAGAIGPITILSAVLVGLGPAIAMVSGALAGLPGLIAGVAIPFGLLIANAEELKKAFAPLADDWKKLQESFMGGFTGSLGWSESFDAKIIQPIRNIMTELQPYVGMIGEGFATMLSGVIKGFSDTGGMEKFKELLGNIYEGMMQMTPGITDMVNGFLNLASAVTGKGMVDAFNNLGKSFAEWTSKPENIKLVQDALTGLLDVIKQLGKESLDLIVQGIKQMSDPNFIQNMKDLVKGLGELVTKIAEFGNWLTRIEGIVENFLAFNSLAAILTGNLGAAFEGIKVLFNSFVTTVLPGIVSNMANLAYRIGGAFGILPMIIGNVIGQIPGIVARAFAAVPGVIAGVFGTISGIILNQGGAIKNAVSGAFSGLVGIVAGAFNGIVGVIVGAFAQMLGAVITGVANIVTEVGQLPGKAVAALGDVGKLLFDSGVALIRGFGEGIRAGVDLALDAARSVLGAVRALFPFSPAKEGPFSGQGYTTYSGKALVDGLAEGITAGKSSAVASITDVMTEMGNVIDDSIKEQQQKMQEASTELGKSLMSIPLDTLSTVSQSTMTDLGMSGNGAVQAAMDYGLGMAQGFANNFVFNVGNMDDAIAGQQVIQNRQALRTTTR